VPDVTFITDGGNAHEAATTSEPEMDAPASADVAVDSTSDGAGDATSDGARDAGPAYCIGPDGGAPPPNGLACCPGGMGEACAGECMPKACLACGNCTWPSVCCTNGANGTCKPYC
jgi:hypothetical protein